MIRLYFIYPRILQGFRRNKSDGYKYEIISKNESHDFRTISDKEISNSPILEVVAVY